VYLQKLLFSEGNFDAMLVKIEPNCTIENYIHKRQAELHEVIYGEGAALINNKSITYKQKHLGNGKYGELTPEELLNIGEIIRKGEMPENLVRTSENSAKSYVYELSKNDVKYRVIVFENADGKKVITMYSDKNIKTPETVDGTLKPSADSNIMAKENVKLDDLTTKHSDRNVKTRERQDHHAYFNSSPKPDEIIPQMIKILHTNQ
jgi:hypothetical protein